jgi:hypothetical protein
VVFGLMLGLARVIEVPGDPAEGQRVRSELATKLSAAHEGLRFEVNLAEGGSLPRFELKAQRVKDEREVWGAGGEGKPL